jgi:hypothetical protein
VIGAAALILSLSLAASAGAGPPAYLRTIGSPGPDPGQLVLVRGVTIGSDGDVFVLDQSYVSRFHPDGSFVSRWDPCIGLVPFYNTAQGIRADRAGSIYVSTTGGGYPSLVRRFDEDGALITDFTGDAAGNPLGSPWGMSNASGGLGMFIADGGTLWSLRGGQLSRLPNVSGCDPGELWSATGVALVGGELYVTEYSDRLQRLALTGAFLAELGSTSGCGQTRLYPRFVTARNASSVLVVDMLTDIVQIVGTSGAVLQAWGGTGSAHGLFYGPSDAAVGPDGLIYIADAWNGRVEVFDSGPTATARTSWGSLKTLYR